MNRLRCALMLAMLVGCKSSSSASPSPPPPASVRADAPRTVHVDPTLIADGRVQTAVAQVRPPQSAAWIPGEIVPNERGEADITALSSGRVASLDVALGDTVKRGQVVLTLDSPDVGRAAAEVLRAKSRAALAQHALSRQLDLESQQATSKAAVDEARAEDAAARADVMAARTLLASLGGGEARDSDASSQIAPTRVALRSPIDGVVTKRSVSLGAPVGTDKALMHVVAKDSRVLLAKLPETLDAQAISGTRVRVRPRMTSTDAAKECGAVILANIGVVDETRSIPLRVGLDDTCESYAAGRYVEVAIPTRTPVDAGAMLLVPIGAVTDVRGVPTIFIADATLGFFTARAVRVGAAMGADIAIESGLEIGERVVVEGTVLLKGELLKNELQ